MERLYGDIRALGTRFQARPRPEVLDPVCMDIALNVGVREGREG